MTSLKEQFEKAVGDLFISWYNKKMATNFVFDRMGEDPPDLVYRDESKELPIEVTSAYYNEEHTILLWKSARKAPDAPKEWEAINPDRSLVADISHALQKKSENSYEKNYVLVISIHPSLTSSKEMNSLIEEISIPQIIPFTAVYLAGNFPHSSDGSQPGYHCWKLV